MMCSFIKFGKLEIKQKNLKIEERPDKLNDEYRHKSCDSRGQYGILGMIVKVNETQGPAGCTQEQNKNKEHGVTIVPHDVVAYCRIEDNIENCDKGDKKL
jgi:hypothetical protein